ncbi:MAG TPA: alanine--glyoxylate aminotransferase family protein, partial [Desulfotignum sp.]|nr:alanine--glyoxylate aminotransferase family protein [Desulfotignum sp.]
MKDPLQQIEPVILMGPGPSCVPPSVLNALSRPTLGHLDPGFIRIMDAIKHQLKTLLHTQNDLTIPISGTGSAGMECCFVNLIEKDDP